jgi:ribose-phosphate pyrophosphokinase
MSAFLLVPLPGNRSMAESLAKVLGCDIAPLELHRFPDGETYLRYDTSPVGRSVAVVCTLDRPDDKIMSLILAASTARDLGAVRVGLIAPYLAYMRQDRRFRAGEALSALSFAQIISAHFDWMITVDPHLHRIKTLAEIYRVPALAATAAPLLSKWIARKIDKPLIIGPDRESKQWVEMAARDAKMPYVILDKTRRGDRRVEVAGPSLSAWLGYRPVLIDDVISSATTMIESVRYVIASGMASPVCMAIHGVFAGPAYEDLAAAGAAQIVTTNTIPHTSSQIDVSDVLAQAVLSLSP